MKLRSTNWWKRGSWANCLAGFLSHDHAGLQYGALLWITLLIIINRCSQQLAHKPSILTWSWARRVGCTIFAGSSSKFDHREHSWLARYRHIVDASISLSPLLLRQGAPLRLVLLCSGQQSRSLSLYTHNIVLFCRGLAAVSSMWLLLACGRHSQRHLLLHFPLRLVVMVADFMQILAGLLSNIKCLAGTLFI